MGEESIEEVPHGVVNVLAVSWFPEKKLFDFGVWCCLLLWKLLKEFFEGFEGIPNTVYNLWIRTVCRLDCFAHVGLKSHQDVVMWSKAGPLLQLARSLLGLPCAG